MATTKLSDSGTRGNKYENLSADNNYMETIASTLVGSGGTASITFSNIPQGYKHLQIRCMYQITSAGQIVTFRANSDSGTNYVSHQLSGNGTAASSSSNTGETYSRVGYSAVTTASYFSTSVIDILDYANTNKYKTLRTLNGSDANGSGAVQLRSGLWMNTAAITSITLTPDLGNFSQYSRFSLYGIKG